MTHKIGPGACLCSPLDWHQRGGFAARGEGGADKARARGAEAGGRCRGRYSHCFLLRRAWAGSARAQESGPAGSVQRVATCASHGAACRMSLVQVCIAGTMPDSPSRLRDNHAGTATFCPGATRHGTGAWRPARDGLAQAMRAIEHRPGRGAAQQPTPCILCPSRIARLRPSVPSVALSLCLPPQSRRLCGDDSRRAATYSSGLKPKRTLRQLTYVAQSCCPIVALRSSRAGRSLLRVAASGPLSEGCRGFGFRRSQYCNFDA